MLVNFRGTLFLVHGDTKCHLSLWCCVQSGRPFKVTISALCAYRVFIELLTQALGAVCQG